MKTQTALKQILEKGLISDEIGLARAMVLDRQVRLLVKEKPEFADQKKQLRTLIKEYENKYWSKDSIISDQQILESDFAEFIVEQEIKFKN